jgi:cyclic beta-1,2-glucan synthetase
MCRKREMRSNEPRRHPPTRDDLRFRPQGELEEPILAELFSVERLEQHAQTLAAAQTVTDAPHRGHAIRPRIAENGRVLLESYRILARAIKDERSITPAAEWLVDNFHIVDEQLREIRDDLPPGYYRELPKLADGPLAGYPRVLGIAWAYIAHTDSRFDPESLRRMVRAYQEVEPLTIGELWAIAISLRILLVDNLRRLADQIVRSRASRQKADELADRRHPCVDSRVRPSRRRPASSSSSACAIRTLRSPPPSAGWRRSSQPRGPPPRRWSASSTSARRR